MLMTSVKSFGISGILRSPRESSWGASFTIHRNGPGPFLQV